jgi:putative two-component system hydrogenase maturation factor HypX/HoxX
VRILVLAHSFNSLTQRLWCELKERNHDLSLELDISDSVTREAIDLCAPDLLLAPFLRRRIPDDVCQRVKCLIVHPGVPGDRGPAALDWAILEGREEWGVTVIEATRELDAGPIWAHAEFALRPATKASVYRDEVATAATDAVLEALARFESRQPLQMQLEHAGVWRPALSQRDRRIDWCGDSTETVLRKLRAADSRPGVLDEILGSPAYLSDPRAAGETALPGGSRPGAWLGRRHGALLRRTIDGAVWVGHARHAEPDAFKQPAAAISANGAALPELPGDHEILYTEQDAVGYLRFEFYNGAMSTEQCQRLAAALRAARDRPTRVLVLLGGRDFWSNGLHLNEIEAAPSPADESWRNIEAIDDVAEILLRMDDRLTVAALRGNAGAGGVFLALAADQVWTRPGIILNPHYRNMGNLYGSEFWTYTLPRRIGAVGADQLMSEREPLLGHAAVRMGLADDCFGADETAFMAQVRGRATELATDPAFGRRLANKRQARERDEAVQPLAVYRAQELARMRKSFYGFDTSYHVARHRFVHTAPHSWTPRHLARHRVGTRRGARA